MNNHSSEEKYIMATALNEADPIQYGAQEYICAMKRLDALKIPRVHEEIVLSLVGRINKATDTFDV